MNDMFRSSRPTSFNRPVRSSYPIHFQPPCLELAYLLQGMKVAVDIPSRPKIHKLCKYLSITPCVCRAPQQQESQARGL